MLLPEGLELRIYVEKMQVKVSGPINDKLLCYALLGAAYDALKDFNDQLAKGGIVPVGAQDITALGKKPS